MPVTGAFGACPLPGHGFCCAHAKEKRWRMHGRAKEFSVMSGLAVARRACLGLLLAVSLAGAAQAETDLHFSLDRNIWGPAAPFLLPLDKGYYKAAGLNVAFEPSDTLLEPIKRVASGDFDMGFADVNALIRYRDANPTAPVKAVFMVYNRPSYAVVSRKTRGVSAPKDLEGKRLGAPSDDPASAAWPIFAKVNNIAVDKVTVENVGAPVREPMLAGGQIDAITGLTYTTFVNLKDRGVPVDDIMLLPMADYGVDLYGSAIIVNTNFAKTHPEAVKGFLAAFLKGLKETVRSPAEGIKIVLKHNDALIKDLESERLRILLKHNIVTDEVQAQGYGGIDKARFARALDQLALSYTFKSKPKPDDFFDGSFLPPDEDRGVK
jgi:NitT/TauT family transport system substrate-binding protein